jgi:hypothetical protein
MKCSTFDKSTSAIASDPAKSAIVQLNYNTRR